MKTAIKLLAVLSLALVALGGHTAAAAEDFNKQLYVTSSYKMYDSSGCIYTQVFVDIVKTDAPVASVFIYRDDVCAGIRLISAYGYTRLEHTEYQVAGNLDWAEVNTKVTLFDWVSQSSFDVYLDAAWTATSPVTRYIGNTLERDSYGPGMCHWIDNEGYHKRDAQASATVSDGETNFTPEPAVEAEFFLGKYVSISGCRPMLQLQAKLRQQLPKSTGRLLPFKFSGVYADFIQVDPSGCMFTYLEIAAGKFLVETGSRLSGAALHLLKYDSCNNIFVGSASNDFVPLTGSEFKISGNSAAIKKTATLYDADLGQSIDVFTNLTWRAAGPMAQNVYSFQWHAPDCVERGHETWGRRAGKASGTISSTEMNLSPAQSEYAEFYWDRYVVDYCES